MLPLTFNKFITSTKIPFSTLNILAQCLKVESPIIGIGKINVYFLIN